jgi:hypothetical protein
MKTIERIMRETCSHHGEDLNYEGFVSPFWGFKHDIFHNGDVLCLRLSNMGRQGWNVIRLSDDEFYYNPIYAVNVLDYESYRFDVGILKMPPCEVFNFFYNKLAPVQQSSRKGYSCRSETTFYVRDYTETEKAFVEAWNNGKRWEEHGFLSYNTSYGRRNSSHFFTKNEERLRFNWFPNPEEMIFLGYEECREFLEREIQKKKENQKKYSQMGGTVKVVSCKGMGIVEVPNGSLKNYKSSEIITPTGNSLKAESYGSGRDFGYSYSCERQVDLSSINWEDYYVVYNDKPDMLTSVFGCRHGAADDFSNY